MSATGIAQNHATGSSRIGKFGTKVFYGFVPLLTLILLWEWVTKAFASIYFPPPSKIVVNFWELLFSGPISHMFMTESMTTDVAATVGRLLVGLLIGSAAGIVFGAFIGRSMVLRELTDPIVEFLRSIPATATLPLFIILLGGEGGMRIAFIAYSVMWFVLINATSGVTSIHQTLIDTGQAFRIGKGKNFFRLILPAALPRIFAGLRIGTTVALLTAVVSELMLATNGIGYRLMLAQNMFNMTELWSWMLLLALLGFILNALMESIEIRLLAWDILSRKHA